MNDESDPLSLLHSIRDALSGSQPQQPREPDVDSPRQLLQDWTPLAQSLESEIAGRYWQSLGLDAFVQSEVPYVAHNTTWVAAAAAKVLFASCEEDPPTGSVRVLELGAGLGLFARHFLSEFQRLSEEGGRDYYARLTYFVTDVSSTTVKRWHAEDLFAGHDERVSAAVCNANDPTQLEVVEPDGGRRDHPIVPESLRCVFANYLLDALPFTILRRTGEGEVEEMQVRTHIESGDGLRRTNVAESSLESLFKGNWSEIDSSDLLQLLEHLDFEVGWKERSREAPHSALALDLLDTQGRVINSYGAIESVCTMLSLLAPTGYVLINDLGPVTRERMSELSFVARFGASLAASINFIQIEDFFAKRGQRVVGIPEDQDRRIHTRLIGHTARPRTEEAFATEFGDDRRETSDSLAAAATSHIHAGRHLDALDAFAEALEACPDDWYVLGQTAQFLTQQLGRPEEALTLVELSLERNPCFSSFLWNTYGNCLFLLQRREEALGAYSRARRICESDPQSHLNLAYSLVDKGLLQDALESIAKGLYFDEDGRFEPALLTKQKEVLALLQRNRAERDERREKRHNAFTLTD